MTITPYITVGGLAIPTFGFSVHGATHGHVGTATIETSRVALVEAGVDLISAAVNAQGQLDVLIYVSGPAFGTSQLFGGEYVSGAWDFRSDAVTIHARDWGGRLVDQKRVLTSSTGGSSGALAPGEAATSGVSTENQTVSQLVTSIANQFGLTPDLRLGQGSNANPTVGSIFGDSADYVLTTHAQTYWGILGKLAKGTGNEYYITPNKHLVFGTPGSGLQPISLTWRRNPPLPGDTPVMSLHVDHNPRRNQTFRVIVKSYDQTAGQATSGQAYVIGSNVPTASGGTVKPGAWGGSDAQAISAAVGSGSSTSKSAVQLYTFHVDGLTQAQAQARAEAIAADIAKRELVVRVSADFIPGLAPSTPATLAGLIDQEFASHQYYVTSFEHTFRMARSGSGEWMTRLDLLDIQPAGQSGKAVG